jgi:uncharacterized protein (TIGR02466 family)
MSAKLVQSDVLFPVPLLSFEVDGAEALNKALLEEIAARRGVEDGMVSSNRGGWHSERDLFKRPEPAHRRLCGELAAIAREATGRMVAGDRADAVEPQLNGWINVSTGQDYHSPHDHPGAFWSGSYYVSVPDEAGEPGRSGEIEFLSGRGGNPHAAMLPAPMTWDWVRISPRPGLVLLFPGHVRHWVLPQTGVGERISIAFNVSYRPR